MVIPVIARTISIGKITSRIKGVFKVVGPSGEEVSRKTKEAISGDLHDGGEHYHVWENTSNGNTAVYAKFTHSEYNPNTKQANVPIDIYINNTNRDPKLRGFFDAQTKADHAQNIIIDKELIDDKKAKTPLKVTFEEDPNQSKLSNSLAEAIIKAAENRPNYIVKPDPKPLERAKKEIENRKNVKELKQESKPTKELENEMKKRKNAKDTHTIRNKKVKKKVVGEEVVD